MSAELIEAMAAAATRMLDSLDPAQRERATRPFENEAERTEWYYTPNARPGIPMMELDARQQQHVRRLLRSGLSEGGYNVAATIMGMEAILDPLENWSQRQYFGYDRTRPSINRDPNMYFVCVFGEPSAESWGWSFGGHHVSVHGTVAGGRVRLSPCFFGANPAESPLQPGYFLRPLVAERDLGLELFHMLDESQRNRALLLPKAPHDMATANRASVVEGALPLPPWVIMGPRAFPSPPSLEQRAAWEQQNGHLATTDEVLAPLAYTAVPKGLSASAMSPSQRSALQKLIGVYSGRVREEIAAAQTADTVSGLDSVHFAWAGGETGTSAHYYRIQGPRLLIEYDSPEKDGSHIHSVWRDPEGDFGMDLLGKHYAEAHA